MRRLVLCFLVLLAGAVVMAPGPVAAAGGGCHQPDPTEGSGQTVRLSGNCMSPTVLMAEAGEITFINDDSVMHNVTGSGLFEELAAADTFTHRFSAGTYPFSCTLHPGMNGVLVVGDAASAEPAAVTPIAARPATAASSAGASGNAVFTVVVAITVGVIATVGGFTLGRRRRA